jgi:hypothetical protein
MGGRNGLMDFFYKKGLLLFVNASYAMFSRPIFPYGNMTAENYFELLSLSCTSFFSFVLVFLLSVVQ